jgi:hypothetical protein
MNARHGRSVAARRNGILASICQGLAMAGTVADVAHAAAVDPPDPARSALSAEFLLGSEPMRDLLPMSAFAAGTDSRPAAEAWTGRLSFSVPADVYTVRVLHDSFDSSKGADRSWRTLPEFDVEFVQVGERLVPTRRGAQPNTHGWWEWIVEPGHVWSEPGDRGRSRAAVPFALIEKNANCVHNGVLTFLYDADGGVSRVALQIAQETCAYFKFDAWAVVPARVDTRPAPTADDVAAAWRRELAARLPTAPIEQLARDRPGTDPAQFGSPSDVTPAQMTAYGVVVAGRHYVGGCMGRAGPYPWCDELVLPSYSIAKSVVAGYGLMRLEQLEPGAFAARISEFVPECATQDGWQDVTFGHALDMATGRYESTEREVDENTMVAERFFYASTHAEKIRIACKRFARR